MTTRRQFLKNTGAAITGVAVPRGLAVHIDGLCAPETSVEAVTNETATRLDGVAIALKVNGVQRTVAIEPQATLAEVLRRW